LLGKFGSNDISSLRRKEKLPATVCAGKGSYGYQPKGLPAILLIVIDRRRTARKSNRDLPLSVSAANEVS
jgi:hypothetical protein